MGAAPAEKWQALINSAILGSERAGTAASDDLARVAMLSPYLRAGRKPRSDTEAALEACPSDDPVCGTEAGRHLEEILFGDQKAVLPEWCRAAEKAGLTAPFELIPDLLSKLPSIESQDVIQRVIGNRGHWLAMQNPEWAAHLTNDQGDPEEIWQTGSRKERLKLLQTLRRRDPARARELLPTTWSEETADDRVSLLSAFGDNLEAADEPLLESLLDDRSARVRALAAGLLSGIEGSALSLRMAERLRPLVAYTRTGLMKKKPRLELALPEAADKPMTHDGLEAKRQGNMGARAVLLSGIVANAPLSVWAEFGGTPADYIAAARAGDWLLPLVNGCAAAAARQRDRSWAEALLAHLIESNVA